MALRCIKLLRLKVVLIRLLSSILGSLGVLWLFVEPIDFFFPTTQETVRPHLWIFIVVGVILGFWRARPRTKLKKNIGKTDVRIEIVVKNIFDIPGHLVIGTNSTFDTSFDDEIIDRASLQGQFTELYYTTVKILDDQIAESLKDISPTVIPVTDKPFGKNRLFPIGSVAKTSSGARTAYLLATAHLNKSKVAVASLEHIRFALVELWGFLREKGSYGSPVVIPVLGTGFSRLNQPREQVIKEIVKSFVVSWREGKCTERLIIVIRPVDFLEGNIDLEHIERYLEYTCAFLSTEPQESKVPPAGTPLSS